MAIIKIKKIISSVDNDTEKLELSYIAGKNIKWCGHFGKKCKRSTES